MAQGQRRVTLAGRVFAALLAISALSATITTVVSAYLHQASLLKEASMELGSECDVLASTLNVASDEVAELSSLDLGEMRATLITPEGEVLFDSLVAPGALAGHESRPEVAAALRDGKLGVLDYYKMKNTIADTDMRESIAKASAPQSSSVVQEPRK